MKPHTMWAFDATFVVVGSEMKPGEKPKPAKKMPSPGDRLKGVSTYNDSKASKSLVSQEVIEVGLSLLFSVVLVFGALAIVKKLKK